MLISQGEGLLATKIYCLRIEVDKLRLFGPRSLCTCLGNAVEGDISFPTDVVNLCTVIQLT